MYNLAQAAYIEATESGTPAAYVPQAFHRHLLVSQEVEVLEPRAPASNGGERAVTQLAAPP